MALTKTSIKGLWNEKNILLVCAIILLIYFVFAGTTELSSRRNDTSAREALERVERELSNIGDYNSELGEIDQRIAVAVKEIIETNIESQNRINELTEQLRRSQETVSDLEQQIRHYREGLGEIGDFNLEGEFVIDNIKQLFRRIEDYNSTNRPREPPTEN